MSYFRANIQVLFLFLCSGPICISQNLYPAQIKLSDGSEIRSLIDFQDWDKGVDRIITYNPSGDLVGSISAENIQWLFLDQGDKSWLYRGLIVEVKDARNRNSAKLESEIRTRKDTVLAQVLIRSGTHLMKYKDRFGIIRYLIQKDSTQAIALENYSYQVAGRTQLGQRALYRTQLLQAFNDQKEITSDIIDMTYDGRSMRKIVERYNTLHQSEIVFVSKPPKVKWRIGLAPGLSSGRIFSKKIANIQVPDTIALAEQYQDLGRANFQSKTHWQIAFLNEFTLPYNNQQNKIWLGVGYRRFESEANLLNTRFAFDASTLQIQLAYQRNWFDLSQKNWTPVVYLGMSNQIELKIHEISPILALNTNTRELGFFVGGGLRTRNLQLDLQYQVDDTARFLSNEALNKQSLSLQIRYFLCASCKP